MSTSSSSHFYGRVSTCSMGANCSTNLGLKLAPLHVALDGLLVVAEPSLKFVIGRHDV